MRQQAPEYVTPWVDQYLQKAVVGVRSEEVAKKIELHLRRFTRFFQERYGHEHLGHCIKRDVVAWQQALNLHYAPTTVNSHLASLSSFATWVIGQHPNAFAEGDPTKGVGNIPLSPLEPRALSERQTNSLKSVCDRLVSFYRLKGRSWSASDEPSPLRVNARPWRDRAIIFVLLSTGLRREELVNLNTDQVQYLVPTELRQARRARITRVQGKGGGQRDVFLSFDARQALADYLEKEHGLDKTFGEPTPLFLTAASSAARAGDGRLSPRFVNVILERIGRWHDAEQTDTDRHISPLRPHDLRHTFAFQLAQVTGADAYELERRLGHRSQRYIQRYTNPPEEIAATYIEQF